MKFPDSYFLTLKKINWLAQAVQAEIQRFQPDLLLVLAHGGFAPLWALHALWEGTKAENIPPVVITNLGREKLVRYEYHREGIGMSFMPIFEPFDFLDAFERGYFLAWLEHQTDWRSALRQQIETGFTGSRQPDRILVMDDTVNKRYTALIALGLLLAEFPQTETHMIAGDLPDWRPDLAAPWLVAHSARRSHPPENDFMNSVFHLAPGASDIDPASLQWEPLNAGSLAMREYGKFLPVETWLELPIWLKAQITRFVQDSANQLEEPLTANEVLAKKKNIHRPILESDELLIRQRWLSGGLTPQDVSDGLDLSIDNAVRLRKNWPIVKE